MTGAARRRPGRRRVAAGLVAGGVLATGAVVVAAIGGDDPAPAAATNSTATTEVSRQDLVERDSVDGTLGYSDSREAVNRLSGTLTWLPATGAVIRPGEVLYRVDQAAVFLMDGRVPAYRTLSARSSDGADVEQLERNLRALGYDAGNAIAIDSSWDAGTTAAVKRWQDAHDLPTTGAVKLGRIVFQPGTRRVAKRQGTLGSSGSSGGGSGEGANRGASTPAGGGLMQLASSPTQTTPQETTPQDTTPQETTPEQAPQQTTPEAAPRQDESDSSKEEPADKQATPKAQSTQGSNPSSSSGGSGTDDTATAAPVLTTTSTRQRVSVSMPTDKQELARVGATVSVELPSGGTVTGQVTGVGKVATAPSGSDSDQGGSASATIKVSVRLAKRTGALDQAPVTVDFQRSKRRGVLAVPVTALLARPGGKFAVEVRGGGGRRRLVAVEPGLSADGYVEISGSRLRPGTKVTDARV